MKGLYVLILLITLQSCGIEKRNPLLGSWKLDQHKTIQLLRESDHKNTKKEQLLQCYESGLCGSYTYHFEEEVFYILYEFEDGKYTATETNEYTYKIRGGYIEVFHPLDKKRILLKISANDDEIIIIGKEIEEYLRKIVITRDMINKTYQSNSD